MRNNSAIDKVGVEIEGGWRNGKKVSRWLKDDGSVEIDNYCAYSELVEDYDYDDEESSRPSDDDLKNVSGEVASSPFASMRQLCKWIRESYPTRVNSSCGLHIHISMKTKEQYALLMHKRFNALFRDQLEKWGKKYCKNARMLENRAFWERFEGENEFCHTTFMPIDQLRRDSSRYTQLNYCAYRQHKTLECRVFPAFKNPKKAVAATVFFTRLVEAYIKVAKPNEYTARYLSVLNGGSY